MKSRPKQTVEQHIELAAQLVKLKELSYKINNKLWRYYNKGSKINVQNDKLHRVLSILTSELENSYYADTTESERKLYPPFPHYGVTQ